MSWLAIVNPAAGRGRTRKLLDELTHAAKDAGASVEVAESEESFARIASDAAATGSDLIACGGDGSVSTVAGIASLSGRRMAVVPTGAGNDFARELGYDTKHPLSALSVLASGSDRVVDLGRVNGRLYTCVTCSGFDSEANRWANTVTRLSGTALYVAAVLRTLAVYKPHPFRITVDGVSHETRAWFVAVGNGPAYAGGMRITPAASMDDGLLDVTVAGAASKFTFLRTFPKVFKGTHVEHPMVQTFRAARVELESLDSSLPIEVYADGERVSPLPAVMEAVPRALTVRVPS